MYLPFTLLSFILLALLFHLTQRFPFSLLYRKYSFYGLLVLLMIEGNVEEFTFCLVRDLQLLMNFSFRNKIYNFIMLQFFYFIILGSTCTFVVYHFQYKKNIKYLVETKRKDFYGVLSSTIDRTMICLAFGFMHRLLLSTPNLQLLILTIV